MYTIGIDISGESVKFGVIGRNIEPVWRSEIPFEPGDPEAMLIKIADCVREAGERYPLSRVGVSCAGSVDLETGRVWGDEIEFDGVPVRDILTEELQLPVWVDSDAQAAMQAEWTSGACKGANHAVYLSFGAQIGGALVVNGQPYRGRANGGAELGHIITHAGGEECACGMRGCYEAYASAAALETASGRPAREAIELARAGDRRMREVFRAYCREICIGMISLMAVFEPEVVVIGGSLASAGRFVLDSIHDVMEEIGPWVYSSDVLITLARHRGDAGIIGAAALAEYYIDDEE